MAIRMNEAEYAQLLHIVLERKRQASITKIMPPALPDGYQSLGMPTPLSGDHEGWWTTLALHARLDVLGMLTYDEDGKKVAFLAAPEAILSAFAILDNLMDLAADCSAAFTDDHHREIFALWQAWKAVQEPEVATTQCVWCWYEEHPGKEFPAQESSSCCARHKPQAQAVLKGGMAS